jgi:dolichol-phosphate mannosyltransferase
VGPELSVVVPTYNERDSLPPLVSRLAEVSHTVKMEVVIVDDASPDGTGALAEEMAKAAPVPVTVVHRSGKAGLASAVLAGAAAAQGAVITVMDADLSHPPTLLPALLEAIRGGADVAVASRYVRGGGVERWPLPRRLVSRAATLVARIGLRLTVRDPLSGFFAVRRGILTEGEYIGLGYKLLVEILARHPGCRVVEVPYRFVDRQHGESKLSPGEIWSFLKLLVALRIRH